MKWSRFKELVDAKLAEEGLEDAEINYMDLSLPVEDDGYRGLDIVISNGELSISN